MKNLIKILPIPQTWWQDEDEWYLDDTLWGGMSNDWYEDGWFVDRPLIIINERYVPVSQDVWNEARSWSGTHKQGIILLLSDEDIALFLLTYGGL